MNNYARGGLVDSMVDPREYTDEQIGVIPEPPGETYEPKPELPGKSAGMPDIGEAPLSLEKVGGAIKRDMKQGWENFKKAAPVRALTSWADNDEGGNPHGASFGGAGKRILGYLMGEDAAPAQAAAKFVEGVKHEHPGVSDEDANVVAIHKAFELGGPEAAWQMLQFQRGAYNAKQSFAQAALFGTAGKPADPQAAAQAATQAAAHIPDGSAARFVATPDGTVTATVRGPDGKTQSYQLSRDQFGLYLDTGGDGQFDKVIEQGGVEGVIQRLAQAANYQDDDSSTVDKPIPDGLLARANALFPSASQHAQRSAWMAQQMNAAGAGRDKVRQAAVTAMGHVGGQMASAQGRENAAQANAEGRENAAGLRAEGDIKKAGIMADASRANTHDRVEGQLKVADKRAITSENNTKERTGAMRDVAGIRRDTALEVEKSRSGDREKDRSTREKIAAEGERGKNMRSEISDPNAVLRGGQLPSTKEINQKWNVNPGGGNAPQAPTPQAATPTGQQLGTTHQRPGTKQFNGRWYTREEYEALGK